MIEEISADTETFTGEAAIDRISELTDELDNAWENWSTEAEPNQRISFESWIDYLAESDIESPNVEKSKELEALRKLYNDVGDDWDDELVFIRHDCFDDYIIGYIRESYPDAVDHGNKKWPYNCLTMDYDQATQDAYSEYSSYTVFGIEYLVKT